MWALENRTPFAAERTFTRDREGAEVLLVAVRATFDVVRGSALRVADLQSPVRRVAAHREEPARSSLVHESDFAPTKRATDVLLLGTAQAREGKPTIAVEVSLRVGAWHKRLFAFGDRRWGRSLGSWRLTDPEPFTRMPLVYERAFGGAEHAANPVGVGATRPSSLADTLVPNLEDPDALLRAPNDEPRPMCFSPIAREWPVRRHHAGTFDDAWRRERRPLLPNDFDDAFWQAAPSDQRAEIVGGEEVELLGVDPLGPLRFTLPRPSLSVRAKIAGRFIEQSPVVHTALFEPDEHRVTLVYASAFACHHDLYAFERVAVQTDSVGLS